MNEELVNKNPADEPHWPDDCEHGGYVCTIPFDETWADCYLFTNTRGEQSVCIRYGKDWDYYSPGTPEMMELVADNVSIYADAIEAMKKAGKWPR